MSFVAITGGMGAGKSTVLKYFQSLGAEILDADDIVHNLYQENLLLHEKLTKRWGTGILDNKSLPDRQKIATIVFQSENELKWLNSLLHPMVKEYIKQKLHDSSKLLFCAIPLLYEIKWEKEADFTIALWCDKKTQLQRLLLRNWTEEEIESRLKRQLSMDEKANLSDFVIMSNCSFELMYKQCDLIFNQIKALIKK